MLHTFPSVNAVPSSSSLRRPRRNCDAQAVALCAITSGIVRYSVNLERARLLQQPLHREGRCRRRCNALAIDEKLHAPKRIVVARLSYEIHPFIIRDDEVGATERGSRRMLGGVLSTVTGMLASAS